MHGGMTACHRPRTTKVLKTPVTELTFILPAPAEGVTRVVQPFGSDHSRQFWLRHLERDLALVLDVVGQVDRCTPSPWS